MRKNSNLYRINLDKKNDVLYLSINSTENSYGCEPCKGLIVLHDIDSDVVTGITIFDFLKRYNDGSIGQLPLPFPLDFKKDVIDYLT